MKKICCSVCKKVFETDEYFLFDDTSEEYFCYDCRKYLNKNHNPIYAKLKENGNLKIIKCTEYAAGPISSDEWIIYDFDEFYKNHTFCPHAKDDFYNHVPVFSQNKRFFCLKCYEYLEDQHGECVVYLGDNKVRSLHYGFFPYSNIEFNFLTKKLNSEKFYITISVNNLKSSDIQDLDFYLFSFSKDLEVYEDEIEWFSEIPKNLANLIIFKEFHLNILNSNKEFKKDFNIEIPNNLSLNAFDLAFKNNLLTEDDVKLNKNYGIKEFKKLISVMPLALYIVISFKTNYEVSQTHIEKIIVE